MLAAACGEPFKGPDGAGVELVSLARPRSRCSLSSEKEVAMPVPGLRIGNSSSGMGMGPEILPRIDSPALGRGELGTPAAGADLNRLDFMAVTEGEEGRAEASSRRGRRTARRRRERIAREKYRMTLQR